LQLQPDEASYKILIEGYILFGHLNSALEVFLIMKENRFKIYTITYKVCNLVHIKKKFTVLLYFYYILQLILEALLVNSENFQRLTLFNSVEPKNVKKKVINFVINCLSEIKHLEDHKELINDILFFLNREDFLLAAEKIKFIPQKAPLSLKLPRK
jgi:pentatricopeptide repeat protein